jgi:hypothetical protein
MCRVPVICTVVNCLRKRWTPSVWPTDSSFFRTIAAPGKQEAKTGKAGKRRKSGKTDMRRRETPVLQNRIASRSGSDDARDGRMEDDRIRCGFAEKRTTGYDAYSTPRDRRSSTLVQSKKGRVLDSPWIGTVNSGAGVLLFVLQAGTVLLDLVRALATY